MSIFKSLSSRTARLFFGALIATVCWLPISAIAQPTTAETADITGLNVFGDSLVDAGNVFNLSGFPPSPPYAQQLSNGPVWTTQLAEALNLTSVLSTEALPNLANGATSLPTEGINFALAGSLSSQVNVASNNLPGLQQQVVAFQEVAQTVPPDPNALYVLLAGGNDYNLAVADPVASSTLAALPDRVTDNLVNAASALIESGAQRLMVGNLPDLSGQPLADSLDRVNPQSSELLSELSLQHNQRLSQKLAALEAASDTEIIQLDLGGLFLTVSQNPEQFGFKNVTDACLIKNQPGAQSESICDNPDEFLFWDEQHPTVAGHRAIAQLALSQLIPEDEQTSSQKTPNSLGFLGGLLGLMSGVGIVAVVLRRRL